MEDALISGVTYSKDDCKLTVLGIKDKPGIAAAIFRPLAAAELNVDMIVQDVSEAGINNLSFTVGKADLKKAREVLSKVAKELQAGGIHVDEAVAKVSVVGVGMRSHSGVAAQMFDALARNNVNIDMISTSEIKISVVIPEKDVETAVRAIHEQFKLGTVA